MLLISKTTAGILIQRDDLDIQIDQPAIASTLGAIITSLIDCGRIAGRARTEGYEDGLIQGRLNAQIEYETSRRIAERQALETQDVASLETVAGAVLVSAA